MVKLKSLFFHFCCFLLLLLPSSPSPLVDMTVSREGGDASRVEGAGEGAWPGTPSSLLPPPPPPGLNPAKETGPEAGGMPRCLSG